jgi:hypothetical protein
MMRLMMIPIGVSVDVCEVVSNLNILTIQNMNTHYEMIRQDGMSYGSSSQVPSTM